MTIMVVGASGQLGKEIVRQAQIQGIELSSFGREQLDITDSRKVDQAVNALAPSVLINAAAYTAVDRAEQESEQAFAINRDGVAHLATVCRDRAIPLLHVSTDYVFDGSKRTPYTENDSTGPINVYGRSKLAGEDALRAITHNHVILRTSWVFGSYGHNFVRSALRFAQGGKPLRIVNDQWGAPTSARSIACCLLSAAQSCADNAPDFPWGTYHFSGQPYTTWYEFAREIITQARALGYLGAVEVLPISSAEYPTPAARPGNSCMDSSRCSELLGCSPSDWRADLQEVLREIFSAASQQSC